MGTKRIFALSWAVGTIGTMISAADSWFTNFFGVVLLSILLGTICAIVSTVLYWGALRFYPAETKKIIASMMEDE